MWTKVGMVIDHALLNNDHVVSADSAQQEVGNFVQNLHI